MKSQTFVCFYLLVCSLIAQAADCTKLDQESDSFKLAYQAMAGHFPVPLEDIEYCGVAGYSKLFKGQIGSYETHESWDRYGELTCWQFSDHKPGEPYNCGRKIINSQGKTDTTVFVKHPIPLQIVAEVTTAMALEVSSDQVEWIEYVPVKCGGAWSLGEHGFVVKLKVTKPRTRRQFSARKICSPTPCVWVTAELAPQTWVH